MVSDFLLNPPLWAFMALAGAVIGVRWHDRPARLQGFVVIAALCMMAIPHRDIWEFGIWVCAAYLVDMVGDDAAPGTLLVCSSLFYPLSALGFNPWWCQFGANICGLAALGVIGGMGGGILASTRYRRDSGVDIMGRVWLGRA